MLALVINTEGFIRYSSILSGNTADPDSLPGMVDGIIAKNPVSPHPDQKVMVVIDAGIATEQNLSLLKERGYNYLCVSRTKPKDCTLKTEGRTVTVMDSRNRPITIAEVEHEDGGDFKLCHILSNRYTPWLRYFRPRMWPVGFAATLEVNEG